jgi:hypothetical protein
VDEHVEARTDHRCVLGVLARRLAETKGGDRPMLAAAELEALLRAGRFERCCLPRYLALAPAEARRETQIPITTEDDIEVRVIVWPVGARDTKHPHEDGWTVFVPVRGELVAITETPGTPTTITELATRTPVILRPEANVRHLLRNSAQVSAVSIHVSSRD